MAAETLVEDEQKILVVEDEPGVREVLTEFLTDEGYAVASAVNGRDALDQLTNGLRPCVILLDLTMPVMNGWEFRTHQLADPLLRAIPVVVCTATPRVGDEFSGSTIIHKPIDLEMLLTAVQSLLADPASSPS